MCVCVCVCTVHTVSPHVKHPQATVSRPRSFPIEWTRGNRLYCKKCPSDWRCKLNLSHSNMRKCKKNIWTHSICLIYIWNEDSWTPEKLVYNVTRWLFLMGELPVLINVWLKKKRQKNVFQCSSHRGTFTRQKNRRKPLEWHELILLFTLYNVMVHWWAVQKSTLQKYSS